LILAIGSGDVAVFPGKPAQGRSSLLLTGTDLPYPESEAHQRIRHDAGKFDQVLLALTAELKTPPAELLEVCSEIVLVRKRNNRDSAAFRAALHFTACKHKPVSTRELSIASRRS
jgi:hypothetical protein